jgi:hypothetical protein
LGGILPATDDRLDPSRTRYYSSQKPHGELMMRDKTPTSFDQLMAELYAIPADQHSRHRSNFVYRGIDVSTWDLQTSLQRLGRSYANVEGPLLRSFIKYSVDRELASQTLLYKLAFSQHHGLPTRVLDWTTAPKVALHFAVGDEEHYDKDGIIWAVDITLMRELLPGALIGVLNEQKAFLFSVDMLPNVVELRDLDNLAHPNKFVLFFEPPSLDGRIVNQAAILSVMPGAELHLQDFLNDHQKAFKRIIVRKELKWEIRDKLDQDQINERMLFPGAQGTAKWLKRYYGPGRKRSERQVNLHRSMTGHR